MKLRLDLPFLTRESSRVRAAADPCAPPARPVGRRATPARALVAALLTVCTTTCFTGDGLADQPCKSDEDCNTLVDLLGHVLKCEHNVCGYQASCGDGILDEATEECDDGLDNVESDYGARAGDCSATQCIYLPYCGDGITDAPIEACDDANDDNTDACATTCKPPGCGDGIVAGTEECDDGNNLNADSCLDDCRLARCGDGFVQMDVEECDDANEIASDTCLNTCQSARCGDNVTWKNHEACDDGNTVNGDGCSSECKFENCGNGIIQGQEECDDGDDDNTDECVGCKLPVCGDGVTWKGQEECDDGNEDDADACPGTCESARCGDTFVQAGIEECDDGNSDNADSCVNGCKAAFCGDGYPWAGEEACDDGNKDDEDSCLPTCEENICGDGIFDKTSEGCDDHNSDNSDGCSNDCAMGAIAIGSGSSARVTCVVRAGATRCWGAGFYGSLGNGSKANLGDDPGELPAGGDVKTGCTVLKVATGERVTCSLCDKQDDNQEIRCWGDNLYGTLGNTEVGTIGDMPNELPPKPTDLDKVALDVGVGRFHACALLVGGAVRCWGANKSGYLGHPFLTENKYTPMQLGDVLVGGAVAKIAVGGDHTCALLVDGHVRCWGSNTFGQLGYPGIPSVGESENPEDLPPVKIGGFAVQIAAGSMRTCALLDTGRLRCWGRGMHGALGYQNSDDVGDDEHPYEAGDVKMLMPGDKVVKVVLGGETVDNMGITLSGGGHTCALLEGGNVRCWGRGNEGALGYGSTENIGDGGTKPGLVDVGGTVVDLALGIDYTCALLDGGNVRCWGNNNYGQLGINSTISVGDNPMEMPPADAQLYPNP